MSWSDDEAAVNAMTIFMSSAFHMIISMGWHFADLEGMLALFASAEKKDRDKVMEAVVKNFAIFATATEKAESNVYVQKLLEASPFHSTLMQDVVYLLIAPDHRTHDWKMNKLMKYAVLVFQWWDRQNMWMTLLIG